MAYTRKPYPMQKGTSGHKSAVKQKEMKRMMKKEMRKLIPTVGGATDLATQTELAATKGAFSKGNKRAKDAISFTTGTAAQTTANPKPKVPAPKVPAHEVVHGKLKKTKSTGVRRVSESRRMVQKTGPTQKLPKMEFKHYQKFKKNPETRMLKGTTIFGKTIPEIKAMVKNFGDKVSKANKPIGVKKGKLSKGNLKKITDFEKNRPFKKSPAKDTRVAKEGNQAVYHNQDVGKPSHGLKHGKTKGDLIEEKDKKKRKKKTSPTKATHDAEHKEEVGTTLTSNRLDLEHDKRKEELLNQGFTQKDADQMIKSGATTGKVGVESYKDRMKRLSKKYKKTPGEIQKILKSKDYKEGRMKPM